MTKLIATITFILTIIVSFGQNISKNEADSLTTLLTIPRTNNDGMDILFRLAQYHMFKPGEYAADLDSAKACIDEAAVLNAKIKSADAEGILLLLKSLLRREKGQMKEGKALAESAVAKLKNGKNKYYLGRAFFALSDYYDYDHVNECAEKIRLVELAANAFEESKNPERQAFTLTFLADLYSNNGESQKALGKLDTALALYKSIGHKELQSVFILYSGIYYVENLFKLSLKYGLMALDNANHIGDTSMTLCQINNHIAMTLNKLKEQKKAIDYFMTAFKVAAKYNDNNTALLILSNIVDTYISLNKPGDALAFIKTVPEKILKPDPPGSYSLFAPYCYLIVYNDLKRYREAQVYAEEIVHLIDVHQPPVRYLSNLYYVLAKYYMESGRYTTARMYVNKFDSATGKLGDIIVGRVGFYLKYRLDTALRDYKSAVTNLLTYQKLNDSFYNETSSRQIKQLEVEYETEKNKNEIAVLSQKNQLQQSNLDRTKLLKNFTFGGIVLLVIIVTLLYRQYRQKQKSNTIIVHKNEQLQHLLNEKDWLVKEIHHRVKNNFHIVSGLLEIQSSYLKNKEALSAIKESQNRIHSMSIIHQKLYQSETLSAIHMPEYIYELVEHLRESYDIRNIGFSLQIENIELNHASAITLGLILNEAITNAIKYAFAKSEDCKICISLTHISEKQLLLSIADNGRGLPDNFETKIGASMGMELLQGLTDDLGGSFSIETDNGTHIKVIFAYTPVISTNNVSFA